MMRPIGKFIKDSNGNEIFVPNEELNNNFNMLHDAQIMINVLGEKPIKHAPNEVLEKNNDDSKTN